MQYVKYLKYLNLFQCINLKVILYERKSKVNLKEIDGYHRCFNWNAQGLQCVLYVTEKIIFYIVNCLHYDAKCSSSYKIILIVFTKNTPNYFAFYRSICSSSYKITLIVFTKNTPNYFAFYRSIFNLLNIVASLECYSWLLILNFFYLFFITLCRCYWSLPCCSLIILITDVLSNSKFLH